MVWAEKAMRRLIGGTGGRWWATRSTTLPRGSDVGCRVEHMEVEDLLIERLN